MLRLFKVLFAPSWLRVLCTSLLQDFIAFFKPADQDLPFHWHDKNYNIHNEILSLDWLEIIGVFITACAPINKIWYALYAMTIYDNQLHYFPHQSHKNVFILNDFPHLLQENVDCDFEFVTTSPSAMVSLIDKPSQQSLVSYPPSRYYTNTRMYSALWQVFSILTEYCCQSMWALTCDFQQCGILTSVDSDEPVQPPFKLRNSKCCSVSSLTIIVYSSD